MQVSSWGNLSELPHEVTFLQGSQVNGQIIQAPNPVLAYGMGKSYGDVCLNPHGTLLRTTLMDRFISFDAEQGILECQAGVLLQHIHQLTMQQSWMLPVTPGTQLITVGGAIANDVHGKNHHLCGTFGEHVLELTLVRSNGEVMICSPYQHRGLFRATIGGIGLTGIIISAKIQLRRMLSPLVLVENTAFRGLDGFTELARGAEQDWEYTVAWIDCLSGENTKGIFMRARHHLPDGISKDSNIAAKKTLVFPFKPTRSLINTLSLKTFNQYYYIKNSQQKQKIQSFTAFQYPLDSILYWNRLYGKRGFYQYQCVIPEQQGAEPLAELLRIIQRHQQGSFLVVLKEFSKRTAAGLLSFPLAGLTLALDFPNQGEQTLKLLNELDSVVKQAGGRLYLAKDARMSADFFRRSYAHIDEFLNYKDAGISSAMSRRLLGC